MARTLVVLVFAVLLAGCGGDDAPTTRTTLPANPKPSAELNALEAPAEGLDGRSLCTLLPAREVRRVLARADLDPGRLAARANDSLDLSTCRYAHGRRNVRVIVDAGAQAGRRFFEQQAEMTQKFVRDPGLRPQLVHDVGDDRAWANAGAHWTPSIHMLVAHAKGYIVRVTSNVPAPGNRARREASADVARAVFAALDVKP